MNLLPRFALTLWLIAIMTGSLAVAGEAVTEVPLDLLEPPSPGKAVVYIFDAGKAPVIPSISLFDNGKRLPILLGAREYFRYECDPGLHTFSIDARIPLTPPDDGWVHGMLEEGGIYAAQIDTFLAVYELSALTGHLDRLVGVNPEGEQWTSIARLLKSKPPKPPGKERKAVENVLLMIGNKERNDPDQGFETMLRLNPPTREPLTRAEWEAWREIDALWDSPGGALRQAGSLDKKDAKETEKRLRKKIKKPKRLTGVTALR